MYLASDQLNCSKQHELEFTTKTQTHSQRTTNIACAIYFKPCGWMILKTLTITTMRLDVSQALNRHTVNTLLTARKAPTSRDASSGTPSPGVTTTPSEVI